MAYKQLFISALLSLGAVSPVYAVVPRDVESAEPPRTTATRQFLVEFTAPKGSNAVAEFYNELNSKGLKADRKAELSYDLFNGASFTLDAKHDEKAAAELIDSLNIVKQIWPMRHYYPQAVAARRPLTSRQSGDVDTYSPHVMGGVDKLHAQGYTGKGKHVAILDTGVDYLHPALGKGFGPGFKVTKGFDFVGDAYDGTNTPVRGGPDPYTNCSAHGTHVAGIIGASPNEFNFTGVVPDATLSMYRVFGCEGSVTDDILIEATLKAHEERPDAISISIGGKNGWTEGPWTAVCSKVAAAGTPILLAAGNDGADGLFTGSEAADGIGVLAVGSVDNTQLPELSELYPFAVNGKDSGYANIEQSATPIKDINFPLYATSADPAVVNDACDPLPDSTPDLSQKLVLIRRGTCTFAQKATNAAAKGAKYVLFYNNKPGLLQNGAVPGITGIAMTRATQGEQWVKQIQAGDQIVITWSGAKQSFEQSANNVTGGYMSTFSSWYPTNEAYIKPEISGPGGNIISTVPLAQGGYAVLSGTSMATPFVAGVVALMRQVRPDLKAKEVRAILGTTGTPINFNNGATTSDFLAPIVQQGGGLVNAVKAIGSTTVLDVANLALNDTANFESRQTFTITNRGKKAVEYSFTSSKAATAYTLDSNYTATPVAQFPDLDTAGGVTVDFGKQKVKVQAGKSEKVTVKFTKPTGLDAKRIPIYGGYINIKGTNGDSLNLPYGGIASSLKDAKVISFETNGFPVLSKTSDATGAPVEANHAFSFAKNATTGDFPLIVNNLVMGSSLVRADLIPAKGTKGAKTVLGVKTLGPIAGFPLKYQPRNVQTSAPFTGQLADGTYAPAGNYTILIRALRIFGNPNKASDYDSQETVPFSISYTA